MSKKPKKPVSPSDWIQVMNLYESVDDSKDKESKIKKSLK